MATQAGTTSDHRRVDPGRWRRFFGAGLCGWLALLYTLRALGCPPMLAWFVAVLGCAAIGIPLIYQARVAVVVACVGVLAAGAGLGVIARQADDAARRYVAEHPPPSAPATTTATFVAIPAGVECNYPYSEMGACPEEQQP